MESVELETTVGIKMCRACTAGLLERDKFCRWCGASQAGSETSAASCHRTQTADAIDYRTTSLKSGDLYHQVSGPLLHTVVQELAGRTKGGVTARLVLALISIPIWMIIVLLSPLDAYASAKTLAART